MRYDFAHFRVDKSDWLKGNNAYDDYPEGGTLASTVGVNAFSKPGLLTNNPVLGSTVTASLPPRGVISWGVGSGSSSPFVMAVYTNADSDASFYSVNTSTGAMTIAGSADTGRNYTLGITDTVFYNNKFYTTSETDITEHAADLSSPDVDWWTSTKSQAALTAGIPHPQLVYEGIHYIADGRYLHKNDMGTISTQVFDVPPDHVITSMVEWNGLIYITAEPYKNLDGTIHGLAQLFSWDGLSESWYEQYFLDYRINAMYVYKNRLFMWTNQFMGLWTGSEIEPVRPVSNQVFKCHITATADSMFYADGTTIVRYGAPYIAGLTKKFYKYMSSPGLAFGGIISVRNNNMIVSETHASASPIYYISDINTPSSSAAKTFEFNPRFFKQPVKVRGIVIETEQIASGQSVQVSYVNDNGDTKTPSSDSGTFAYATTTHQGKSFWRFDVHGHVATRWIRPKITLTGGLHIRSIDYLYEGSENKQNK
jgi:hypothetical protein